MIQLLTTGIIDWISPKDLNIDNYSKDSPIACFLEVDLDYPHELHDLHNNYPLVGEKIEVTEDTFFEY